MAHTKNIPMLLIILFLLILPPHHSLPQQPQNRQIVKQCALPPNLNELPDFAQDEIRSVWKEYVPGKKCDKELLITEDILAVLAMFDKELEKQGMKLAGAIDEENVRGEGGRDGLDADDHARGGATTIGINAGQNTPRTSTDLVSTKRRMEGVDEDREEGNDTERKKQERIGEQAMEKSTTMSALIHANIVIASSKRPDRILPPPPSTPAPLPPPVPRSAPQQEPLFPPNSNSASVTPFGPPTLQTGAGNPRQAAILPAKMASNKMQIVAHSPATPQNFDYDQENAENTEKSNNNADQQLDGDDEDEDDEDVRRPVKQHIPTDYDGDKDTAQPGRDNNGGEYGLGGGAGHDHHYQQPLYEQASELPFLKGAKPAVMRVFKQVLEDQEIPSEARRMEEIHILAVSYLNARQLAKFNAWSTDRRKRIHLREHQLSRPARDALKKLAKAADEREQRAELREMAPELRGELHQFAMAKREVERSRNDQKLNDDAQN